MYTNHLHAGFNVSWTSTDISRVQSDLIAIIASRDCFFLNCGFAVVCIHGYKVDEVE
jgi:hypothetical protein